MADSNDEAGRRGEGRRRRPPPTIDARAVEVPIGDTAAAPADPSSHETSAHVTPAPELSASDASVPDPSVPDAPVPHASVPEVSASEARISEAQAPEAFTPGRDTGAEPPSVEAAAATAVPEASSGSPPISDSPAPASPEPVGSSSGRGSVPRVAPAPRARTPWFAILAAGTLGAALTAAAAGAAWVYYSPLEPHDTSGLAARVARLEVQNQTPADVAAATVPGMGNVPTAKLDELAARLAKLEAAPPPAPQPVAAAADTAKLDDLTARVQHLETAVPPAPAAAAAPETASADNAGIKALDARIAALETSISPLAKQVTDLGQQTADTATAAREARERAEAAAKSAADVKSADTDQDKQQQTAQKELAAVGTRLAAVEMLTKQVQDQVAEFSAPKLDAPLRDALIAAGLRSAVERAQPFTAQFAAAKAAGIDAELLAPLAPFAGSGVPNPADLFRDLGALIPEMLKASSPAEQDGGYLERLQAHAERLVRIRPAGDRPGDDAATVIGRIERDMARRDLPAVLAELAKLPAPAQAIAEPWRKKALAREAATKASEQLVTVSFAKLGAAKQ